jgi:predicted nucleic acid-binding protein
MKNEESEKLDGNELKIFPDSSWLIAILDERDSHHKAAESSLGALLPYNPVFYVAPIVYMETMSKLIRKLRIPVRNCYDKIEKFFSNYQCRDKNILEKKEIVQKYKHFSRIKIKELTPIDFYIVSEGMLLNAKILTCDIKMYRTARKYYKDIYFLSDIVKNIKSDLGRLISDVQNN